MNVDSKGGHAELSRVGLILGHSGLGEAIM